MSGVERRTVEQWVHRLTAPGAELTLSEFMALCLAHMRDNMLLAREAGEHTEGMLGRLDVLAATVARLNGLPYDAGDFGRAVLPGGRDGAQR